MGSPPACEGLRLRLRAVAINRWQAHSGWDLVKRQPRAGRKLAPAGSVYWFDVLDLCPEALAALWLGSVCDDEQDRRDGFGMVLPHLWSAQETP